MRDNVEYEQRRRARKRLWMVIEQHPGQPLGELMAQGRAAGMASVERWPRELHALIDGGYVAAFPDPALNKKDTRRLYATDKSPKGVRRDYEYFDQHPRPEAPR